MLNANSVVAKYGQNLVALSTEKLVIFEQFLGLSGIEQIEALPNVNVRTESTAAAAEGEDGIAGRLRRRAR